jgi:hypothetical protein
MFLIFILLYQSGLGQSITRGPFLQMGFHDAITLKWNTLEEGVGKIKYGESFLDKNKTLTLIGTSQIHEIRVTNLKPRTKYYYSIYQNDVLLEGDSNNYFYTSPLPGMVSEPVRMVAFGDCGTLQPAQLEVAKRVSEYFGGKSIDGMLLLGDNAYNYGFDREYQTNFFNVYQNFFLKNTVLWPSPGNHDYSDRAWPNDIGVRPDYYKIFTLPTKGECGGVASGNSAYYSYDYANVHFVSLDSYGTEDSKKMADTLSKQVLWLKKDLAANKLPWTVVYFHHPPYTKGSHNSDTELDLVAIRENLVRVIDYYKVDVVLNGHSHNYERSYMLNKYYSDEANFNVNTHTTSNSTGKYDGTPNSCPYIKAGSGTVYVVAGASGWVGGTTAGYPHNAMVNSNSETTGAMILEVSDNKFVAKYLTANGSIFDQFTIFKDVNKKYQKTIECGELVSFSNSWKGDFLTSVGKIDNGKLMIDSLNKSVQFTVSDKSNCLKDTIQVTIKPYKAPRASSNSPLLETGTLQLEGKFDGLGSLIWKGPNGFVGKGNKEAIPSVRPNNAGKYFLIANYKNCTSLDSIQVDVLKILSSEDPNSALIKVFPNPGDSSFEVVVDITEASTYEPVLLNSASLIIKKYVPEKLSLGKKQFFVDLTLEESGLYFFVLKSTEKALSTKIIKK